MNVLCKVTWKTLWRNPARTIVTIIGVLLSAAMITAVTTFGASMQQYMISATVMREGAWHATADAVDAQKLAALKQETKIQRLSAVQAVGYAKAKTGNAYKPYLYIQGFSDAESFEFLSVHLRDGRLPENASELLVPEHLLESMRHPYQIGDKLTLRVGDRMAGDTLTQRTAYKSREKLRVRGARSYTIVGVCDRVGYEQYSAPGFTCMTRADSSGDRYEVYFTLRSPREIYSYVADLFPEETLRVHDDLLNYMGVFAVDGIMVALYVVCAVIIALIMVGSVALIYNAFSIAVSERTRQFGLLSSVGATKRQLKRTVRFEALCIGAIGIPLGVGSGIAGAAVVLRVVDALLGDVLNGGGAHLRVHILPAALLIAAAIALTTVLISATVPARRAARVTPIEAIRQSADIRLNPKKLKSPRLLKRLFRAEGVIAGKNFRRSRKKYRSTVFSLTISVLLFVSVNAFTDYMTASLRDIVGATPTDLFFIQMHATDAEKALYDDFEKVEGVTRSAAYSFDAVNLLVDASNATEYLRAEHFSTDTQNRLCISGALFFLPDAEFRSYARAVGEDADDYFGSTTRAICTLDEEVYFDSREKRYLRANRFVHKPFSLTVEEQNAEGATERKTRPLEVAAFADESPFGVSNWASGAVLILPESRRAAIFGREWETDVMVFNAENHAQAFEQMERIYKQNIQTKSGDPPLFDLAAQTENSRRLLLAINIFCYGFIALISLIALANVFNTISTNLSLRRREFAMLRSVGMTNRGFHKILLIECLLYGTKSLIYGLPLSAVVSYLLYLGMQNSIEINYRLPWGSMGVAAGAVFLVVLLTMVYSMRKIQKQNILDTLKNENL